MEPAADKECDKSLVREGEEERDWQWGEGEEGNNQAIRRKKKSAMIKRAKKEKQ